LKRRVRNGILITVIGFGTFYAYRGYRRHQWFHAITESEQMSGKKPRIVVLGTGNQLEDSKIIFFSLVFLLKIYDLYASIEVGERSH
jgi:hypothetical protein